MSGECLGCGQALPCDVEYPDCGISVQDFGEERLRSIEEWTESQKGFESWVVDELKWLCDEVRRLRAIMEGTAWETRRYMNKLTSVWNRPDRATLEMNKEVLDELLAMYNFTESESE